MVSSLHVQSLVLGFEAGCTRTLDCSLSCHRRVSVAARSRLCMYPSETSTSGLHRRADVAGSHGLWTLLSSLLPCLQAPFLLLDLVQLLLALFELNGQGLHQSARFTCLPLRHKILLKNQWNTSLENSPLVYATRMPQIRDALHPLVCGILFTATTRACIVR